MTVNRLLLENTLKKKFILIMFTINSIGEVKENALKMHKKDFLKQMENDDLRVKLVDEYPVDIKNDILYIKKDGSCAWIQEEVD